MYRSAEDLKKRIATLWHKLKALGLLSHPHSFSFAYQTFVQPSVTFGCEIWGVQDVWKMCCGKTSPFAPLF